MDVLNSFNDFRSLSKLAFAIFYFFFFVQMLIFYWKITVKMESEVVHRWKGILKVIAKAAHYEIIPSMIMFFFCIFTLSFNLVAILLFLITIIGDTLIVLGYHRKNEGTSMLLLGRILTHGSALGVLIVIFSNTFYYGRANLN